MNTQDQHSEDGLKKAGKHLWTTVIIALFLASFVCFFFGKRILGYTAAPEQNLIKEAVAKGAVLIVCREYQCREDGKTQILWTGQDGLYLVYPIEKRNDTDFKKVQEEVKKLNQH